MNVGVAAYAYWVMPSPTIVDAMPSQTAYVEAAHNLVLLSEAEKNAPIETVRMRVESGESVEEVASDSSVSDEQKINLSLTEKMCVRVGSFRSLGDAKYFVDKLGAQGVRSEVKNVLVSTAVGFWLHLPPLSSRKELLRRLAELHRQGVDSYAIPDGDLANGISLGMFSEQARAKSLKERIARLGYRPEIAEVPREKRELWIFLSAVEAQKISDEKWFEWLSAKELPKKQQILCSDVASA